MSNSIRISKKHGVNPSIGVCYFCNEENGEVVLPGMLKDDVEAPHKAVWHKQPCEECKSWMEKGVICISVRDGESGDNPYRTGAWMVLKDEALTRLLNDNTLLDDILKRRVCFLEDVTWDKLGFPREEIQAT